MKYTAILFDSFREARDSKMLYVLFALSLIVILFVSSLTFTPLPAEQTFRMFFNGKVGSALHLGNEYRAAWKRQAAMKLEKVEVVRGEPDSPLSEYALTVLHFGGSPKPPSPGKDGKEEVVPAAIDIDPAALAAQGKKAAEDAASVFKEAQDLELIDVVSIEPVSTEPSGQTRLLITVQGNSRTVRLWANEISFLFGAIPPTTEMATVLGFQIFLLAAVVVSFGSWLAVLMGVVITAFFVPNMLRKGTVDLLLVKPVHRWALLLYKYVGGLSFIFLSTAFAMVGIWAVLGLRTGIWAWQVLLIVPTITFFFAILYAVSTLTAVMTRSTITCILVTCMAWFFFFLIGLGDNLFRVRHEMEERTGVPMEKRVGDGTWARTTRALYNVTPRTDDLNHLNSLFIACGYVSGDLRHMENFSQAKLVSWESLVAALVWIVLLVAASCAWFSIKDY